jgi:hypothetical protein
MLAIDRTDKSPFPRGGCLYYSDQLMINFNGFGGKELLKLLKVYPYDTTYNCRFNMPVLEVGISAYDLNGTWIGGHSRNTIFLGDNALDWNDKSDIEPQNDSINVKTEQDPKYSINSIFYILNPGKEGEEAIYIRYDIKNNVPILKEINTNLITQRGK